MGETTESPFTGPDEAETNDQIRAVEAQGEGDTTPQVGVEKKVDPPKGPESKKYKLKLFGEEIEKEFNAQSDDEVKNMLQKAMAYDKRAGTLKQKEDQVQAFMNRIQQADIVELAKMKGINEQQLEDMAAQILVKRLESEKMTPEQRELQQLKQERAQREQLDAQSKQQILQELSRYMQLPANAGQFPKEQLIEALQQSKDEYTKQENFLDQEISTAWKESGLPPTKAFVTMIAQEMYGAGLRKQDLTPKTAADIVKANWHENVRQTLEQLDAQAIHEILGESVLKKVRKFDVDRVSERTSNQPLSTKQGPTGSRQGSQKQKSMTENEWQEYREKLLESLS